MRYVVLACVLILAIAFDLGTLLTPLHDPVGGLDGDRPATVVPIISARIHDLRSRVHLHVTDLVDALTATYRAWMQHQFLPDSEPQEM